MANENPTRGRTWVRYARAAALGGDAFGAAGYSAGQRWTDASTIAAAHKAAVTAQTAAEADALLAPISTDFAQYLRARTLLGRMQGLRRAPARTRLLTGGGSTGAFVTEGQPIPVSAGTFRTPTFLEPARCSAIGVATVELLRSSDPAADALLGADLSAGLIETEDREFLDPTNDGTSGAPQSVLNDAAVVASSGSDVAAIDVDLKTMFGGLIDEGLTLDAGYWVMRRRTYVHIALLRGAAGAPCYPDLASGRLLGMPVLVSDAAVQPGSPSESVLALIDAGEILVSDPERATIEVATAGALEMRDDPTNDSSSGTATAMVSMFQTNSVAFKASHWIAWRRRRPVVAAYMAVAY